MAKPYRVLWVLAVFAGSVLSLPSVWALAHILNGLMAVPNLVSLIALTPVIFEVARRHI
ncbi:MAG TPA: hypothetical protein DD417_03575 [Elusimicrobia bacterium]|nr:hypothetical protein [Elusimicrobiota bacterium]